eukprot:363698-Chlamydomonas_euryale.AAC.4
MALARATPPVLQERVDGHQVWVVWSAGPMDRRWITATGVRCPRCCDRSKPGCMLCPQLPGWAA